MAMKNSLYCNESTIRRAEKRSRFAGWITRVLRLDDGVSPNSVHRSRAHIDPEQIPKRIKVPEVVRWTMRQRAELQKRCPCCCSCDQSKRVPARVISKPTAQR